MHNNTILAKNCVPFTRLQFDLSDQAGKPELKEYDGHESRATRLVGDSKRFLTVSFTVNSNGHQIRSWLQRAIDSGIHLGEVDKYAYLGFTENNLKAGHLLFFREGPDFTVETLKQRFGDLKAVYDEYGYGKYAARLGLSFSSTIATEEIDPADTVELPDLLARDGSLTSDGSGLICDSYCSKICAQIGVSPDTAVLQIRQGGKKGTLVRCPDALFDQLCGSSNKKIAYRRSMIKYAGGPQTLEVQGVSRPPKSGRLNKQFIILLLTRGIPLSVFEELLQIQLEEINKITLDREKALDCVRGELDAESGAFNQDLYEMLLAGHDMSEPYLATLLRRFQNTCWMTLREKLHIPVKDSGNMFGVVDQCSVLQEGEVYINLRGPHVGPVAVLRNPAYDPAGIRVLEAVNKPELKHLTNCIVFSASGAHSETDRMGGGDLDGDQYYVIFNPLLIPAAHPPPIILPKQTRSSYRTITIAGQTQTLSSPTRRTRDMHADAIETFIDMRCNFLVGEMSKAWMKLVGSTPNLAHHPGCQALIPLIEEALDAVKQGGGVKRIKDDFWRVKRRIEQVQFPAEWKNPLELLADEVPAGIPENMEFKPHPDLILRSSTSEQEWQRLVSEAEHQMRDYNQGLKRAIDADKENQEFGFKNEKRADIFKAEIIAENFPSPENLLLEMPKYALKASVWYCVGYANRKQSFAWLGGRWLNFIKAMRAGRVPISVGARSTPLVPAAMMSAPSTPIKISPQGSTQSSASLPARVASLDLGSAIAIPTPEGTRNQPGIRGIRSTFSPPQASRSRSNWQS
ncbi:RdRP-domain-containing protein [Mycena sanguinolenta]|nr:RdRP-domain-containing protein [Mycena sanguinolenta]